MALMQARNAFGYTPFFYLCDRDKKATAKPENMQVFQAILKDLVKQVDEVE